VITSVTSRLNTLLLVLLVLMAAAIIGILANRAGAGPLDPPSAPSATGTLPQVEPRMPIPPVGWNGTFPITISQPGSYFLTRNLDALNAAVNGIVIASNDVNIDLNGFTLDGGGSQSLVGIVGSTWDDLRVSNGVVRGWTGGIDNRGRGALFYRLQLTGNTDGMIVGDGATLDESTLVSNNIAVSCDCGLRTGATIKNSTFFANSYAIQAGERFDIESNHIDVPAGAIGINLGGDFVTVRDNVISNLALTGYVPVSFNSHTNTVVIKNRIKAGLSTGDAGGNVMPYDTANALTNVSP
jgi:hypothetical protein